MTGPQAVVVGGGLVGLATAYALTRRGVSVCVVEKDDDWAQHQSARNSGVLHSGVFYPVGSLRLELARHGAAMLEDFCRERDIGYRRVGKTIVATSRDEVPRLLALEQQARAKGVTVQRLTTGELRDREPHVAALAALWVESSGVIDYPAVSKALVAELQAAGAELLLGTRALSVYDRGGKAHVLVQNERCRAIMAGHAVICAGLQADRLYQSSSVRRPVRIAPFRGEYAELVPDARDLVRGLVYPVPEPGQPFAGIHLTKTLAGHVLVGPSTVPAFSREGYRRRDLNWSDLRESLAFPGTWRMARRNVGYGVGQLTRSLVRPAFLRSARKLLPELESRQLRPAPAGVRAQAVDADGRLLSDFDIRRDGVVLHVLNAPSPGATASLALGEYIAERL